ncbi:Membrane bound L-sorbosone dehydrogenase [Rhodobacteraceae bacterium THAF1]|uniref:PQQ-dependent sugar dehydrogenase n=1 Tax=Palleronia sp. THAF1 TaxID=2587842 RepID=UPI000F3EB81F|nr:sorbosone dehydrogenase family protein [Palleronia sp. THAF1]QFU08589.1 Membrane bound L-sorbosone dehydrogenase [Palleronia sp. THAF1]VDC30675.1 Membrane bound L-sorbosone dehydrogenase [Rhodobacteraceae bacterium THAF1]
MRYLLICALLLSCGERDTPSLSTTQGATPELPAPRQTLLPTVNIAPAKGWPKGAAPVAAEGLTVQAFHTGLDHPRWMHVLPNGDVLVAEANKQDSGPKGLRSFVEGLVMGRAGARVPSADRISLLRDADGDGVAEGRTILLDDLTSPFGMALMDGYLYVANTDGLVRVPFAAGQTEVGTPEHVADLPAEGTNRHWTKGLLAHQGKLYVSVGADSDHGENGLAAEEMRAAVLQVDPATGAVREYATGIRNPVGMDVHPGTGMIWAVVNERDELGDNLVPDYLTRVRDGDWYGWPHVYWGGAPDPRVDQGTRPEGEALRPDYALGAHVAPLGLTFADGAQLGHGQGAYVGLHGSWNRVPASGYEVVFVPFSGAMPSGKPQTVLSGFLDAEGNAYGRPVGVEVAPDGALLVADDVGNTIWRVSR